MTLKNASFSKTTGFSFDVAPNFFLFQQYVIAVEEGNVKNHPKRVLAKFCADRNHPRWVISHQTAV